MTVEDEIWVLTGKWMEIVGRDVHKDRDCHFYIEKRWSYGEPPYYEVWHEGYIWDELIEQRFETSKQAHLFLRDKLKEMVAKEDG